MNKYKPVLIYLTIKQDKQLRKMSYVSGDPRSKIIRFIFDNYIKGGLVFTNPPKENHER